QPRARQTICPDRPRCLPDFGSYRLDLGQAAFPSVRDGKPCKRFETEVGDNRHFILAFICLGQIRRTAPSGLEQFIYFVIANLEVSATCDRDGRRIAVFQDFLAVRSILDLKCDTEACIAPDLVVDDASRLLGGQDQVDTKAPADPGCTDELADKVR